jgi:pimeloyl-ACP methyl ester carboxylesterase
MGMALAAIICSQSGCSSLGGPRHGIHLTSVKAAEDSGRSAAQLETSGDVGAVDAHFVACRDAWQRLIEQPEAAAGSHSVARAYYNERVADLLRAAGKFGRLDLAVGLLIRSGDGWLTVPVVTRGFTHDAAEFERLSWPPMGREPLLLRRYGRSGVGVPLVLQRKRNESDPIEVRFLPEKSHFAATAVLQFDADDVGVIELVNPLEQDTADLGVGPFPLAADLSAPLATTLEDAPRTYFAGFVEPGAAASMTKLAFLEPYHPGKVPVVLVHGLFSDPLSWGDLVNDTRAAPGFDRRYQIWTFRYPTGQGFLQSAAALRRELRAAIEAHDPHRRDPALRKVVLVGHSMGGLISKLQVTSSDDLIWSRLANRPLDEIVTTEETRGVLAETCFFEPSPDVARVIFIASPHRGSLRSSSLVGQGAALLVEPSAEQSRMHEQLIGDNPHTFNPLFERRFPTSIDMLSPKSPLLEAMKQMPIRRGVKLHNILGVKQAVSLDGPSDGVVSVRSASHPECHSVLGIYASHTKVHRELDCSREILRILECSPERPAQIHSVPLPEQQSDSWLPSSPVARP